MAEPREWITVKEAAVLVGRDKRQIYRWIERDRLATRRNADGILEVLSKAIVRVEKTVVRGRPRE
ncbi:MULTISPECIES: helix-turn-helix domain-containing protein [unclassified Microbacterium]|uniref:helix-turn-helix domain-containing protein n=1 Tax=unclassified Microbacterium TaxID=2609290 RepID=UPI00301ADE2E